MEELLSKLISKGYKPFGIETKILHIGRTPDNYIYFDGGFGAEHCYSFRDFCSKESGLWQFVCENRMIKSNDTPEENIINYWRYNKKDLTEWWYMRDYEYRLIQSALLDEDKLEDFILDNVKIGNED